MRIEIVGLAGLPEVKPGDDLASFIRAAAAGSAMDSRTVVAVAQKVVSKAEGSVVDLRTIEPSGFARRWALEWDKDARVIELVLRESRRIVKMERGILIAETHHGLVAANAGVDQSNVPGEDCAAVLPRDPDGSARKLLDALACGAVIITDTFGRPWREGLVNVAIGVAGLVPLEDWRGRADRDGRPLKSTIQAIADELASAASLVMRKDAGVPVALIHGFEFRAADGTAASLVRPPERDLFR